MYTIQVILFVILCSLCIPFILNFCGINLLDVKLNIVLMLLSLFGIIFPITTIVLVILATIFLIAE